MLLGWPVLLGWAVDVLVGAVVGVALGCVVLVLVGWAVDVLVGAVVRVGVDLGGPLFVKIMVVPQGTVRLVFFSFVLVGEPGVVSPPGATMVLPTTAP